MKNSLKKHSRVADFLQILGSSPPPSLILEGGNVSERFALALYWAARINCSETNAPCLNCSVCTQIQEQILRDLIVLDGRTEAISIDAVRTMRADLGNAPVGAKFRVIILAEAQNLHPAAANALLKSMEEPLPGNLFILTVPQRESILPTLVSRSFVLTLAWQHFQTDEQTQKNLTTFISWLKTGTGLFNQKSRKEILDSQNVRSIFLALQQQLLFTFFKVNESCFSSLQHNFSALKEIDLLLNKGLEEIELNINPLLVHDTTALHIYDLLQRKNTTLHK